MALDDMMPNGFNVYISGTKPKKMSHKKRRKHEKRIKKILNEMKDNKC